MNHRITQLTLAAAACLLMLFNSIAICQEEDELESLLDNFDKADETEDILFTENESIDQTIKLTGDMGFNISYNYAWQNRSGDDSNFQGLSQSKFYLRPSIIMDLFGNWELRISGSTYYDALYKIDGSEGYNTDVLHELDHETEFRDSYIRGNIGSNIDLKIGRQTLVWGKSDNLRVVDIINPLDLKQLGMSDVEDLRLPVTMTRFDYYRGKWNLTAAVIHELRFNKTAEYGSEFFAGPYPPLKEKNIHSGGSNTEYALSMSGLMEGWDISFHLARLFNDKPFLANPSSDVAIIDHSRISMAGVATNIVKGDWLLKSELAFLKNLQYSDLEQEKVDRVDYMIGFEYNGFDNQTWSLEAAVRHIKKFDLRNSELEFVNQSSPSKSNKVETAFRYNQSLNNDRLKFTVLAMRLGEKLNDGGFTRVQFQYELKEALIITSGLMIYHHGSDYYFDHIATNDRVFANLEYSF